MLRECRDTFGIVANQKNLELKYNVADGLPPVLGDRGRLVQVFMNLISNAIKYTIQGSVSIEAEEREFAVSVRIRDTGVGLTPEEKEKLFQKFYRTRSGLTSSEGGTGLGLVIVRGLVEAHGGTIVVDSVPGQGTCFTLTFPATASIVNVEELVQVAPDSDAGPESQVWQRPVWIIDPDQRSVESMTRILEDAGPQFKGYSISVVRFASIHEVPEVVSADQTPYLVVVDPIDGGAAQVIPALRTRVHKTVPILVASSSVDAIEVFAEGASALVTKPIGEREFLIAVKDLMGGKGWRVLIADRNTDLRILIKRSLEQRGFIVDDVDRGSQVLARLDQEDYDLALIDMNFSDVSGPDLLRVIRKGERFKSLSVFVMLEEDKNIPTEADLAAWGANAYVGKDKGIGGIVDSVCQYLEDRKLIEHPT